MLLASQIEIAVRKLSLWHPSVLTLAELKFSRHHGMHYLPNLEEIVTGFKKKPVLQSQQHQGSSLNIAGTEKEDSGWDFDRSTVGLGPCKDEEEQVRGAATACRWSFNFHLLITEHLWKQH